MQGARVRLKIAPDNESLFIEHGLISPGAHGANLDQSMDIAIKMMWSELQKEIAEQLRAGLDADPIIIAKSKMSAGGLTVQVSQQHAPLNNSITSNEVAPVEDAPIIDEKEKSDVIEGDLSLLPSF